MGWAPADFLVARARDVMVAVEVAVLVAVLVEVELAALNVTRLAPPGFESVHPMLDLDLMDLL